MFTLSKVQKERDKALCRRGEGSDPRLKRGEGISLFGGGRNSEEGGRKERVQIQGPEEGTSVLSSKRRETGRGSVSKVQRERVQVQGLQEGGRVRSFKSKIQRGRNPIVKQREGDGEKFKSEVQKR